MQAHAGDPGVFIRSMATRGHLGGLARATGDVALVLDAAGKDIVIIETVGVGQDEVDIVRTADISVVTLVPGTGDDVQALKAGIMEIADIFVVNKADREGADRLGRVDRGASVAADVRRRAMAAADPEDRGDDRPRRRPSWWTRSTVSRAMAAAQASASARGPSSGCAICWRIGSCRISSDGAAPRRVRSRSIGSRSRARSISAARRFCEAR